MTLAGLGEHQQLAQNAFMMQQRGRDRFGHRNQRQRCRQRHAQHAVQHGEHAADKGQICVGVRQRVFGQQLHQTAANHGGLAYGRWGAAFTGGRQQHGSPAKQLVQAEQHHGLLERGDLAMGAKASRVDEAQQVEGQGGVLFENFLDRIGAGLLAYQRQQLDDALLRRGQKAGLHHRGAGKPETLEKLYAQALAQLMLVGTFDFFGDQLGAGVAVGELDQHCKLVRCQRGEV